jgi:hypothetical protein
MLLGDTRVRTAAFTMVRGGGVGVPRTPLPPGLRLWPRLPRVLQDGKTALDLASEGGHAEVVALLGPQRAQGRLRDAVAEAR